MAKFTFVDEPSLEQRNSRSRYLIQSTARSHASSYARRLSLQATKARKHARVRRKTAWRRETFQDDYETTSRDEIGGSHEDLMCWPPIVSPGRVQTMRVVYSDYLDRTYSEHGADHINRIFNNFLNVIGPAYFWRTIDGEDESQRFKDFTLRSFMFDPGYAESFLAVLQCIRARDHVDLSNAYGTLVHRGRSLSLIRKSVESFDPGKADLLTLLWTISLHLILDEESNDKESFETHFKGCTQVVDLMGGTQVLKSLSLRTHSLWEWMVNRIARNLRSGQEDTRASSISPDQTMSILWDEVHTDNLGTSLLHMPSGVSSLYEKGRLTWEVAWQVCAAINVLDSCYQRGAILRNDANFILHKTNVEAMLADTINQQQMTEMEFILCMALSKKLNTTPPYAMHRTPEVLLVGDLMGKLRSIAAEPEEDMKVPLLWAVLVMIDLPLSVPPKYVDRLSLLQLTIEKISPDRPWDEVRNELARIYMDGDNETSWKIFWNMAVQRRTQKPESWFDV